MTQSGHPIRSMNRLLIFLLILWISQIAAPQDAPNQPKLLFTVESMRDYEILQFVYGFSLAAVQDTSQPGARSGKGRRCIPDQVEPLASSLLANLNRRFGGDVVRISDIESAVFEAFDKYYVCGQSTLPVITYHSISELGLETIVLLGSDGLFRCMYSVDGIGGDSRTKVSAIDIDPARHQELSEQFKRLDLEPYLRSGGSFNLSDYHQISVGQPEGDSLKTEHQYEVPKHDLPASAREWLEEVRLCASRPDK